MKYIKVKNKLLYLERIVEIYRQEILRTNNYAKKLKLKTALASMYSDLWLDLYELRNYKTLDEDRDPLYKRLIIQRNIIGTIENTR